MPSCVSPCHSASLDDDFPATSGAIRPPSITRKLSAKLRGKITSLLGSRKGSWQVSTPRGSEDSGKSAWGCDPGSQSNHSTNSHESADSADVLSRTSTLNDGTIEHDEEQPAKILVEPGSPADSGASYGPTIGELKDSMRLEDEIQRKIIPAITEMVEATVALYEERDGKSADAAQPRSLSPSSFIKTILKWQACSPCAVICGLVYLRRLKAQNPRMKLVRSNFRALLTIACMIASKYCDDFRVSNEDWADIGGMKLRALNSLELEMVFQLDFRLFVSREEYKAFLRSILKVDGAEPVTRGDSFYEEFNAWMGGLPGACSVEDRN